jgi:MoxR-like ATPase
MIHKIPTTSYPLQLWQSPYINQYIAPVQIEHALKYYHEQLDSLLENLTTPNSSNEFASLPTMSIQISESLNLLTEVLGHLQFIENTRLRVCLLDNLSKCYAKLERIKAYIQQRDQKLLSQQVTQAPPQSPPKRKQQSEEFPRFVPGRDFLHQFPQSDIKEEKNSLETSQESRFNHQEAFSETPQESQAETKPPIPITNYQLPITNPIIVLGKHPFQINTQPLELTLVPYEQNGEKKIAIHILGTEFFETLVDDALNATQEYWNQSIVSESDEVYRGEYLAVSLLLNEEFVHLKNLRDLTHDDLLEQVRRYMAEHDDDGYELGIHDLDATLILEKLLYIPSDLGLLGFEPSCRAIAQLFWVFYSGKEQCRIWQTTVKTLQQLQATFGDKGQLLAEQLTSEISQAIEDFIGDRGPGTGIKKSVSKNREIADYLIAELKNEPINFTVSTEAMQLVDGFRQALETSDNYRHFEENLRALRHHLTHQMTLAYAGITSYAAQLEADLSHYYLEAVAILLTGKRITRQVNPTKTYVEVTHLVGQHPRIKNGTLHLQIDEFLERTQHFIHVHVPAFHAYQQLRQQVIEREKKRLCLEEFKAQPLPTFVANRLIKEVYLNFIGDNFAKQIETIDVQNIFENSEIGVPNLFWNQGMLLLLSPAGYGKTMLMEYLAHDLGLIFVKINGITLGDQITSLDPAQAPNLIARQELEKLNFALQLANHVMLFLDNIQQTHPTFLQKFTTLADTQRKIDGVWQGKPQTYHLRGKRFCLVMAGNPYANSGERFQIPEDLANRADIYHLGQLVNDEQDFFALSYIENALPIHPVLAALIKREPDDLEKLIRLAQGEKILHSEFSDSYSSAELEEITAILKNLFRLQKIVFKIHLHYIASATQAEQSRTEPPFKLQGSYHDMNQMAIKVVANMRDEALESLIDTHYFNQAQTLGAEAEVNLLKLAKIRGTLTTEQAARWKQITTAFNQLQNPGIETHEEIIQIVAQINNQLSIINDQLMDKITQQPLNPLVEEVQHLNTRLATLPKLVNTLSSLEFNIINQPASGLEDSLKQMIDMVEQILLPIVQDFERKSKLDLMIFERIKDVGDTLKGLQKNLTTSGKKHKIYKALSFK